jgi:protoporphyrinogen oxidase
MGYKLRKIMIVKLTIDRFEGDKAVLKTEDNDAIIWPQNKLPNNLNEGSALLFVITGDRDEEKSSKQLAKDILNEILNTGEEESEFINR